MENIGDTKAFIKEIDLQKKKYDSWFRRTYPLLLSSKRSKVTNEKKNKEREKDLSSQLDIFWTLYTKNKSSHLTREEKKEKKKKKMKLLCQILVTQFLVRS